MVVITYCTDLEGDFDYFVRFCSYNSVLTISVTNHPFHCDVSLQDDAIFVYGGDVLDKAAGDIRLCRTLVEFKKKYPNRVHLLIGNRDVNKILLHYEKTRFVKDKSISSLGDYFWANIYPGYVSYKDYLKNLILSNSTENDESDISDYQYDQENTLLNRTKWVLEYLLGAKNSFENRRIELSVLTGKDISEISDTIVLNNIFEEIEFGCIRQYLELAQLIVRIGNSVFVHGAIKDNSVGFIPSSLIKLRKLGGIVKEGSRNMIDKSLDEWILEINEFKSSHLADWTKTIDNEIEFTLEHYPGEPLLTYAYNEAMDGKSTMVSSFFDKNRQPNFPGTITTNYLYKNLISRVIYGHKPVGDHPFVMLDKENKIEYIAGDTSYSGGNKRSIHAMYELSIIGDSINNNQIHIKGKTHNHQYFDYYLFTKGKRTNDEYLKNKYSSSKIGLKTNDGKWIRGIFHFEKDRKVLFMITKFEGRKCIDEFVDENELQF